MERGYRADVLDDGFVILTDYMGSDKDIVDNARVSYGKGTKTIREDRGLIRYLMRHRHTTPFERPELVFLIRVPMDCWRQWIRHRTASVNEYSTRYSIAIDSAQTTAPDEWRSQSLVNRQGSETRELIDPFNFVLPGGGRLTQDEIRIMLCEGEKELQDKAREVYNERIRAGVAREQARKDLPLCTYTEAYWKIDLHNLLHFLELRMDQHAQREIREYANNIGYIVKELFPLTWEAFVDYRLGAMTLSRQELEIITQCVNVDMLKSLTGSSDRLTQREKTELISRLQHRLICL